MELLLCSNVRSAMLRILQRDVWVVVFNATFKNISDISWWSVLLVEETGENHLAAVSH
jgi:hypothetical protein